MALTKHKSDTIDTIIAVAIILWIFIGGISIFWGDAKSVLIKHGWIEKEVASDTINIDWGVLYPFEDAIESHDVGENTSYDALDTSVADAEKLADLDGIIDERFLDRYNFAVYRLKYHLENAEQYILGSRGYLELCGRIQRLVGIDDFGGAYGVVKLKNGYLSNLERQRTSEELDLSADNLKAFSEWLGKKDIPLLYVQPILKNSKYDNQLPDGVEDYTNENLDGFLSRIEKRNIQTLDLRTEAHKQGIEHYGMFYITDHHWNVPTGIWASREVGEKLNRLYGWDLDTSLCDVSIDDGRIAPNESLYSSKTYEGNFLGSEGCKVTLGFIDAEDFVMYSPRHSIQFRMEAPDKAIDLEGNFDDVMYDTEQIARKDVYNSSPYGALMYGLRPVNRITALADEPMDSDELSPDSERVDGKRILFIHDSFSLDFAPYFTQMVEESDWIDPRPQQGNFTGSVKSYVEEMERNGGVDAVIVMYYPDGYGFN